MPISIRSRLLLLVLAVWLPALAAGLWIVARACDAGQAATPRLQVAAGALLLLGLAVTGALWLSRRIAADAAEAMRHARTDLERQLAEAVAAQREAGQRVSQHQRAEALGRLSGAVAHDFNNLLGVISNSAHLIQRKVAGPEVQVPVAATLRAVEAGSRLTQHLLRFASAQPSRPELLDLAAYLGELQDLLKFALGRHIDVAVAVAPQTQPVRVDANGLEMALIHMALNARDAMPNGGHVWLDARNAGDDDRGDLPAGAWVLIAMTDDGAGTETGPGFRLSQVRGFCVQAGGTARLAGTPGLGATVSLVLPAGP